MAIIDNPQYSNQDINSQRDRITELLQQASQPSQPVNNQIDAALSAYVASQTPGGKPYDAYKQTINENVDRGVKANASMLDLMTQAKDKGDADAKAVYDTAYKVTGGEPQAMNAVLTELHNDPEEIDASNAVAKTLTAASKLGLSNMDYRKTSADIDVKEAQAKYLGTKGTGLAPRKFSPDQAAKLSMMTQGIQDAERFKNMIIKSDGTIDRKLIGQTNPLGGVTGPVPFTKGTEAYSYIYNAIESKLRAESGAAVPETEVTRMARRFVPSYSDTDAAIKSKMQRLEDYLGNSLDIVDPSGQLKAGAKKGIVSSGGIPDAASQELMDAINNGDTNAIQEFNQTFGDNAAENIIGQYGQ